MDRGKYFYMKPHQGKEKRYVSALTEAGWGQAPMSYPKIKFALLDSDWNKHVPQLLARHVPVFLYPHAARPTVQWDGALELNPQVTVTFVPSEGHKHVLESFGYPVPIVVTGWPYDELQPFKPAKSVGNILFAPIHPNANGYLSPLDKEINRETFEIALEYCQRKGVKLVVRYLQTLEKCGLPPDVKGVRYVTGMPNGDTVDMDRADLVISHQTYAWLAVAKGKPTLMMAEYVKPHSGNTEEGLRFVQHWHLYQKELMYPYDVLSGVPMDALVERASQTDLDILAWKARFMERPFDRKIVVDTIQSYI